METRETTAEIEQTDSKTIFAETSSTKTNTFSKSIMGIVLFMYLIGAVLGTGLVIFAAVMDVKQGISIDSSMFIAYAAYLGGPTATSIVFYAWKSKAENVLKIAQSSEMAEILSNMEVN